MNWIQYEEDTIQVDADSPELIVETAKQLRNGDINKKKTLRYGSACLQIAITIFGVLSKRAEIMFILAVLFFSELQDFSIRIVKRISLPGRSIAIGRGEPSINN